MVNAGLGQLAGQGTHTDVICSRLNNSATMRGYALIKFRKVYLIVKDRLLCFIACLLERRGSACGEGGP
jgi:hypothetical protein